MSQTTIPGAYGETKEWQYAHPSFQTSFHLFMKIIKAQIDYDDFVFERDQETLRNLVEAVNNLPSELYPCFVLDAVNEYTSAVICDELKLVIRSVERHLSNLSRELPHTPWYMGTTRVVLHLEADATGSPIAVVYLPACVLYDNNDGWLRRELPDIGLLSQGTLTITNDAAKSWPPPAWQTYSVSSELPELPMPEQLDESNSQLAEIEFPFWHADLFKWTGETRRALKGVALHD